MAVAPRFSCMSARMRGRRAGRYVREAIALTQNSQIQSPPHGALKWRTVHSCWDCFKFPARRGTGYPRRTVACQTSLCRDLCDERVKPRSMLYLLGRLARSVEGGCAGHEGPSAGRGIKALRGREGVRMESERSLGKEPQTELWREPEQSDSAATL